MGGERQNLLRLRPVTVAEPECAQWPGEECGAVVRDGGERLGCVVGGVERDRVTWTGRDTGSAGSRRRTGMGPRQRHRGVTA